MEISTIILISILWIVGCLVFFYYQDNPTKRFFLSSYKQHSQVNYEYSLEESKDLQPLEDELINFKRTQIF